MIDGARRGIRALIAGGIGSILAYALLTPLFGTQSVMVAFLAMPLPVLAYLIVIYTFSWLLVTFAMKHKED